MSAPAPVTTLDDVIDTVIALLTAVGDARDLVTNPGGLELLRGERHLREEGAPPRIIFVPGKDGGAIGPVLEVGTREACGITETVRCYVWGAESSPPSDAGRQRDARARAHRLLNAFIATAAGRITGGKIVAAQDTNIVTHGAEYLVTLSYEWAVPQDEEIWDAAYALAPADPGSPPDPDRPQGDTGHGFHVAVAMQNLRS